MNFQKAAMAALSAMTIEQREAAANEMWHSKNLTEMRDDAVLSANELHLEKFGKSCPALDAETARRKI